MTAMGVTASLSAAASAGNLLLPTEPAHAKDHGGQLAEDDGEGSR